MAQGIAFTPARIAAIRARVMAGEARSAVALDYGHDASTVRRLCRDLPRVPAKAPLAHKDALIAAMVEQGFTREEAGREFGASKSAARRAITRHTALAPAANGHTLALPAPVASALAREAKRRDTSPDVLALQLLTVIAADGLFAAVLDDAPLAEAS